MSADDESDDFEKLLQQFINSETEADENKSGGKSKKNKKKPLKDDSDLILNDIGAAENDKASELLEEDLAEAFAQAREDIQKEEDAVQLGIEESELAQAISNFSTSVNNVLKSMGGESFEFAFDVAEMYPNYKPRHGRIISSELARGWVALGEKYPNLIGNFNTKSSDEEFLNFAEKINNQDLQLAVISYVEIIIDTESCEISYKMKLAKYQEQHIKKIMYEEYLARKERQQRFVDAVKKRNFPIDAERLIANYFKTAQKDVDGAFKALTTNPAIFAPIDFAKIKPRLFGLIKVSPKDGIRLNIEIGKFLKKLKV